MRRLLRCYCPLGYAGKLLMIAKHGLFYIKTQAQTDGTKRGDRRGSPARDPIAGAVSPSTSTTPNDAPAVIAEKRKLRLYFIPMWDFSCQSPQPSMQIHLCRPARTDNRKGKMIPKVSGKGKTLKSPFAQPLVLPSLLSGC